MWRIAVEPDYFQFYARRSGHDWASDRVTSPGHEAHLWSDGGFVYFGTARKFGTTSVVVEVWDGRPPEDISQNWQHIAEVSLGPGGDLEIYDWGSEIPRAVVAMDPEAQRLRVRWTGLVADRFDGLDDLGNSHERLLLQLWPEPTSPSQVVQWWPAWELPAASDRSPDGRRQAEGLEAVIERLPTLQPLTAGCPPHGRIRMPGGRRQSSIMAVLFDPAETSWWVDGYDVRRTLREVTKQEAEAIITQAAALNPP